MNRIHLLMLIGIGIFCSSWQGYPPNDRFELPGKYYAITPDGPRRLTIAADTAVFITCNYGLQCWEPFKRSYLVKRYVNQGDLHILLVAPIPSPVQPTQGDQYKVFAIKELDKSRLQLVDESVWFPALDSIPHENMNFYGKFSFAYYSEKRLNEMKNLKSLDRLTREEFGQMKKYLQNELSDQVTQQLVITKTGDAYGTAIAREMWNITLLKFGYNPLVEERTLSTVIKKFVEE